MASYKKAITFSTPGIAGRQLIKPQRIYPDVWVYIWQYIK